MSRIIGVLEQKTLPSVVPSTSPAHFFTSPHHHQTQRDFRVDTAITTLTSSE